LVFTDQYSVIHSQWKTLKKQKSNNPNKTFLISFVPNILRCPCLGKSVPKTISPVDDGTKQHSMTEYGRKEPIKIVLKEIKPKS
jgi:hypothetical protein